MFKEMYDVEEYYNITNIPRKYEYQKNNEICNYRNFAELYIFLNKKDNEIYINNMWCEIVKYVVEIEGSYRKLKQKELIKKSLKNEKNKQIFETYFEIFKKIKLKKIYNKKVDAFLHNNKNFLSIQIRKGSCDFKDYRVFLDCEDIRNIIIASKNITEKHNIKKWFIASDCMEIKQEIISESNNRGLTYLKHKINRRSNDDIHASIELEILSRGNYFIITNQSSFGIVSLFKSGKCIELDKNEDCVTVIGKGCKDHIIQFFYRL